MLILREYKVDRENKWLTVDIEVNPKFEHVYIQSMRVSTTGDFTEEDKSAAAFDALISSTVNEYTGEVIDWEEHPTKIRVELDISGMIKPFYLEAVAVDPEGEATTCAYKNPLEAVTFNKYPIYRVIACAAHEMDGCDPPQAFIDYLMRLKALEASIAIGDKESINAYFDWLILHGSTGYVCGPARAPRLSNPGCGCHH
jgi:hypothetical protein